MNVTCQKTKRNPSYLLYTLMIASFVAKVELYTYKLMATKLSGKACKAGVHAIRVNVFYQLFWSNF